MNYFIFIIFIAIAYLLGSVNSGIIIAKVFYNTDIREHGSHNAGATNTLRTLGTTAAASVFALDILKPIIVIVIARLFFIEQIALIPGSYVWFGFFSIVGQCYPIFFGFKGGKGASSTLGTLIAGFPLVVPIAAAIFLIILFIWKYVSLSTMVAIGLSNIFIWFIYPDFIIPYVCITLLILWRHRENIMRLLCGEEKKFSVKKKDK